MLAYIPFIALVVAIFWAIVFIQSGLDKVLDWSGNLSWLKGHFAQSPLRNLVPMLLATLTVVELAAGLVSGFGATQIVVYGDTDYARYGVQLSAVALLMLFFGQRMNKEYAGAATLATYFAVVLLSLFLLI